MPPSMATLRRWGCLSPTPREARPLLGSWLCLGAAERSGGESPAWGCVEWLLAVHRLPGLWGRGRGCGSQGGGPPGGSEKMQREAPTELATE